MGERSESKLIPYLLRHNSPKQWSVPQIAGINCRHVAGAGRNALAVSENKKCASGLKDILTYLENNSAQSLWSGSNRTDP
jgi:hypothetical protein